MVTLPFTEGHDRRPVGAQPRRQQLLPNIVDGMADSRPSAVYAMIPKSFTSYDEGYRKVTYPQFANAINGVAWHLIGHLGRGTNAEAVAYVGPNDISYVVFMLGASKAGYAMLSISPRNTKEHHASLFKAVNCQIVLTLAPPYAQTVHNILDGLEHRPKVLHVPTIYELLDTKYAHFPYPYTFEAIGHQPLMITHTSGTTGMPKPVVYSHASADAFIRWHQEPCPDGYYNLFQEIQANRVFMTFPLFHAGAHYVSTFGAIATQTTIVIPLAGVSPSVETIVEGMKLVDVDTLLVPAPFVDQIAKNKAAFDFVIQRISAMGYGGGDISDFAGNAFASQVRVVSFYGSTESTTFPTIRSREDRATDEWKYIEPHPFVNAVFEQTAQPELFEAVIVRNDRDDCLQPVFTMFPDLNQFRTKDLFSPHPQKPNLWLFRGRADDMLVLMTGENCNPLPFEQAVARLPEVQSAVMVGTRRWRCALLIEPNEQISSPAEESAFIERVWPTIEAANQELVALFRVAKTHILLTIPERPIPRSGKGTIQRAATLDLYSDLLDELYRSNGEEIDEKAPPYQLHLSMANGTADETSA